MRKGYKFQPGRDDTVRGASGTVEGWIGPFGELLYCAVDAAEKLEQHDGINVGVINKAALNVVDEQAIKVGGAGQLLLVIESFNKALTVFCLFAIRTRLTPSSLMLYYACLFECFQSFFRTSMVP